MRVVVDTNILISALFADHTPPGRLVALWRRGGFDLVTSQRQLDEFMRVTRNPKIRTRAGVKIVTVRDFLDFR